MNSPDDEFDDFLRRRRPLFSRDDELEPPAELDRLVLRRARDALERERPQRVFRAPPWAMPVALAATLVLGFTIFLRVGTHEATKTPEVTVQNVSRPVEYPAAAAPAAREMARAEATARTPAATTEANDSGAVVVDLGAGAVRSERDVAADAGVAAPAEVRARRVEKLAGTTATAPAAKPDYRRDAKTWLAEIDRLRAAGDSAHADAELAEYKREFRAYAGAPDR